MSIYQMGPHRVRHGNVMDTEKMAQLMGEDVADIFYSDPPWGMGNLKYWATMNKKMTGDVMEQPPLDDFLDQIFELATTYCEGFLCIEYGCRWSDMIQAKGVAAGFTPLVIANLRYRSSSKLLPLHLHVFTNRGYELPPNYVLNVTDTHGFDCITKAVSPLATMIKATNPDPIIMDPCCGMGYTAQVALNNGLSFRGNELNSKRLQKTLNRFHK